MLHWGADYIILQNHVKSNEEKCLPCSWGNFLSPPVPVWWQLSADPVAVAVVPWQAASVEQGTVLVDNLEEVAAEDTQAEPHIQPVHLSMDRQNLDLPADIVGSHHQLDNLGWTVDFLAVLSMAVEHLPLWPTK